MRPASPLLFLTLAIPILSAPIPLKLEECFKDALCRPFLAPTRNTLRNNPHNPAFPPHQLANAADDDIAPVLRSSKGEVDEAPIWVYVPDTTVDMPVSYSSSRIVGPNGSNCHESTTTVMYGYSYIKREYTDMLIVGVVILFFVAVMMVEMMAYICNTSRSLLGMNNGTIRLEDASLPKYEPREKDEAPRGAELEERMSEKQDASQSLS